ncbi:MAG: hypothetical protein R6V73_08700 [Anaerolineales bacterium]|jgi:hypothetical protein
MEDKITIIEGPPPTFEMVEESWALGLNESPFLADIAITRLRTFNGPALVERCHRAWRNQQPIHLEYRETDGLEQRAPIVAARHVETEEGDLLILWVRLANEDAEIELDYEDDGDEEGDQDSDYPLGPADWSL